MVKMEFVPHIRGEILLGPSMSESEKCMAILEWKGSSISIFSLLRHRESNGQEQEDDVLHASSLTEISCDKRAVIWLYERLHRLSILICFG